MEKKNQIPKYPHLRFPEFTDEWKEVKLGEVAHFSGGGTPSSEYSSYWEGTIPWISSSDIQNNNVTQINVTRFITKEALQHSSTKLCKAPCVLVVTRVGVGKVAYSDIDICTSQDFCILTDIQCEYHFLSYYLLTVMGKKVREVQGTSIKGITMQEVKSFHLCLPSLPEQRKIAALLSLIDERIEVQNAIIKEQEALKASLLRRLFDRTLRFPEFTDEWKEYQNSEVFEIISEKNTDLKYSNVVSASMNHGVVLRDEIGIDIKYEQENIRGYKVVRDGDYIVHLRSFQGGFAFSRLNGICSPAYTILRPRPNMLEYGFLEAYFYSSRFITSLKQVTYGIRDGRSISIGEWMQEKTSLPSLPEQRKIADLLSAVDELIAVEKEYATLLQKQKAYLLRQMFV